MVFDTISEKERTRFFEQNYGAHIPGYTGYCPTLKFRVGKRFGACTKEIMEELLEKKILKTGPYTGPKSGRENGAFLYQKDDKPSWSGDTHFFKTAPPYILGYTGHIPGYNSRCGLSFMRTVEEGVKEWRENQMKLRGRRHAAQNDAKRADNMLVKNVVTTPDNYNHDTNQRTTFYYDISPERPPIVGYTGHIPGARGEISLSKRYAQAAKKGLEWIRKEREQRHGKLSNSDALQRPLDLSGYHENSLALA